MLKEKPSDRLVMGARNALYSAAERSGMTGLRAARDLERQIYQTEAKYLNSKTGNFKALGNENSLDRFHNLTEAQKRELQELEKYTGVKFIDELDALTAGRYLEKFKGMTPQKIISDLTSARNPNLTKIVKGDFENLLGKGNFDTEYDDLMAHFANSDFNLVNPVPGAGGGIFAGRSGLMKSGVAEGAKRYYRDVKPGLMKAGSKLNQMYQGGKKSYLSELEAPMVGKRNPNTAPMAGAISSVSAAVGLSLNDRVNRNKDSFNFTMLRETNGDKTKQINKEG
jgi:hypothetical protein